MLPFRDLSHPNARAQRAFLLAYARTGTVTRAAVAARIDRRTHQHWMAYPGLPGEQYRLAFLEAQDMAADALEDEARRRSVDGLVRYRFTKDGSPILHPTTKRPYYELEYSDRLLEQLLKANRPEKYRDRVEHSGPNGGPIAVRPDLSHLTDEELAQLEALLGRTRPDAG